MSLTPVPRDETNDPVEARGGAGSLQGISFAGLAALVYGALAVALGWPLGPHAVAGGIVLWVVAELRG